MLASEEAKDQQQIDMEVAVGNLGGSVDIAHTNLVTQLSSMLECNEEHLVEVVEEVIRKASEVLTDKEYLEYCGDLVGRLAEYFQCDYNQVYSAVRHHTSVYGSPIHWGNPSPPIYPSATLGYSPSDFPENVYPSFTGPVVTATDEARATRLPDILPPGKDKSYQVNFIPTVHIDPKSSKEEIQRFAEYVRVADLWSPPIYEFWAYFHKKVVEVDHILKFDPLHSMRLETAELDKLWMDVEPFRPVLAVMLLHAYLQVEDSEM